MSTEHENGTKFVITPVAELGYLESGPSDGVSVVLVHGFPDDARTWQPVIDRLEQYLLVFFDHSSADVDRAK